MLKQVTQTQCDNLEEHFFVVNTAVTNGYFDS